MPSLDGRVLERDPESNLKAGAANRTSSPLPAVWRNRWRCASVPRHQVVFPVDPVCGPLYRGEGARGC